MKIVRLEVEQGGPDAWFPIGSLFMAPPRHSGRIYELFRRKHRGGTKQTWWVKAP